MDAAVDVRLSIAAMRMAEARTRSELAARSMLEMAVNTLRKDTDRAFDTLSEEWADTIRVSAPSYSQYLPSGSFAVIVDLERFPPRDILYPSGTSQVSDHGFPEISGTWLNVMTARPESWRLFGFSESAIAGLCNPDNWDNESGAVSMGFDNLEYDDLNLLNRLSSLDVLRTRSEHFHIRIDTTDEIFTALVRRSPATGTVYLRSFRRSVT